jgi:lantibiotic modifying enzyme
VQYYPAKTVVTYQGGLNSGDRLLHKLGHHRRQSERRQMIMEQVRHGHPQKFFYQRSNSNKNHHQQQHLNIIQILVKFSIHQYIKKLTISWITINYNNRLVECFRP